MSNISSELDSLQALSDEPGIRDSSKISLYNQISQLYALQNPQKALEYALLSSDLALKNNDSTSLASTYRHTAAMYLRLGNISDALNFHLKSLHIYTEANNRLMKADVLQEIGIDYVHLKEYQKALSFIMEAKNEFETLGHNDKLCRSYNNLGGVYYYLESYDSALYYYYLSEQVCSNFDNSKILSYVYHNIGDILQLKGNYVDAKKYVKKSLSIKQKEGNTTMIPNSLITLGNIELAQNNLNSSEYYFLEALRLSKETNSNRDLEHVYKQLVVLYKEKKQYKEALAFHEKLLSIVRIINDDIKNEQLSKLSVEFETEKIQQENHFLLEKDVIQKKLIKKQKATSISVIIILFLTTGLLFIIRRNFTKEKKQNLTLQQNNIIINTQAKKLSSQNKELQELLSTKDKFIAILGHDIRNPLSTLLGFIDLLDYNTGDITSEQKQKYLTIIKDSVNQILHLLENLVAWGMSRNDQNAFNPKIVSVVSIIDETFKILDTQAEKKNINLIKEGELGEIFADPDMVFTICRNLITNAIKFSEQGKSIVVKTKQKENFNFISVIDQGVGISDEKIRNLFRIDKNSSTSGTNEEHGTGLGLILCKEFAVKNKGDILVESVLGKGSKFIIKLPLPE
jgi:signal transduction histidine kinase